MSRKNMLDHFASNIHICKTHTMKLFLMLLDENCRNFLYENLYNEFKDATDMPLLLGNGHSINCDLKDAFIELNYFNNTVSYNGVDDPAGVEYKNLCKQKFDDFINQEIKTNFSFEFLLLSRLDQLWTLIYRKIKEKRDKKFYKTLIVTLNLPNNKLFSVKKEVININRIVYGSEDEDESEVMKVLNFLKSLGLVYLIKDEEDIKFYTFFEQLYSEVDSSEKSLVLETNFKLYAYSTKSYDLSVLKLFAKILSVIKINSRESFIRGIIDESIIMDSIKNKKINLEQIIDYLYTNARNKNTVLNKNYKSNLIELMRLWVKSRVEKYEGVLIDGFRSYKAYQDALKVIGDELIYKSDEDRTIFISDQVYHKKRSLL
ncbi:TFB2 [Hepatospora eriocheir]|uniref:RNA polymerase II transcription factor B subunit 2 n=1 Tax=Hepatospora eriocheir TaxID=1081669 RepID=A0A1X0Q9P4_9MICR|nr:TFB2 [Hepatospora eriocheir]